MCARAMADSCTQAQAPAMKNRDLPDLKTDWRRWTIGERITAIALIFMGSFASAVLTLSAQ
jgi:hypothetical protein